MSFGLSDACLGPFELKMLRAESFQFWKIAPALAILVGLQSGQERALGEVECRSVFVRGPSASVDASEH